MVTDPMRFERHGRGASFVELWLDGSSLMRIHGRIGSPGALRVEEHRHDEAAAQALQKQLRRLETRRFMPGWHHPEMMAVIQSNPDAPGPYLVYADWLLERQDPRGELITRMAAGRPVSDLLAEHSLQLEPSWWSTLPNQPATPASSMKTQWRLGFLERLKLHRVLDPGLLRRVLRHPSAQALREVIVDGLPNYFQAEGWESALRERPPTLQRIVIPAATQLVGKIPGLVLE